MNKQIITIEKGGQVSGLQRKPGQGLNLQTMGKAQTERVSEIKWHEDVQAWFVLPITGPFAQCALTQSMWREHVGEDLPEGVNPACEGPNPTLFCLYFADYDLAVKAEIAFLDAARAKGIF